jgi:probable HAF family extracellular repeat protein
MNHERRPLSKELKEMTLPHRSQWRAGLHPLAVVCALLLAAVIPTASHAVIEYDFFLVEAFNPHYDLREVIMRDINESGVACGTSTYESSYAGFVWNLPSDKTIAPITWTRGLNDIGLLVGENRVYNLDTAQSTVVPPAGGYPITSLFGINNNGIAVGDAECSCSNSDRLIQTALLWDTVHGSRTTGITAAKELLRINDSNVAAGNIRLSASHPEGFLYWVDSGAHINLSDLLPTDPYGRGRSELSDINDAGVVCGRGWDGTAYKGMVWSEAAGFTFLPALDGGPVDQVRPQGINLEGRVVGFAQNGSGQTRAFVWDAQHGMRDLTSLCPVPQDFLLDWGVKINDRGWITGIGHYGPAWGTSRGFVLRPSLPLASAPEVAGRGLQLQVSPNPISNGEVAITFALPRSAVFELAVFDGSGRTVARLHSGASASSSGRVIWNPARDNLASGVYWIRLASEGRELRQQLVVVR